jgi:hypothetical protein
VARPVATRHRAAHDDWGLAPNSAARLPSRRPNTYSNAEGCPVHATLHRLDRLATYLAADSDVIAVTGLGSAGQEHHRFDEHSDIDFFVITEVGATQRFLDDQAWLTPMGPVAYTFLNVPNGGKVLFDDGLFAEYAIFTMDELARLPFAGARVVWARPGQAHGPLTSNLAPPSAPFETVEFHLNEALTNLYVGLHREQRGERLTAMRFIQVYAMDRLVNLLRLTRQAAAPTDPFEVSRRVEASYGSTLPLERMLPGYEHNADAARATLDWLTTHFPADPAIVSAIEALLPAGPVVPSA